MGGVNVGSLLGGSAFGSLVENVGNAPFSFMGSLADLAAPLAVRTEAGADGEPPRLRAVNSVSSVTDLVNPPSWTVAATAVPTSAKAETDAAPAAAAAATAPPS
mmetsp:Transcript_48639/g.121443  ORF Transcript_48639/g.121443 Transcript_48639/m.121443 type:complete len:104 (+) Transcript_48639:625-936(+)